MSTGSEITVEKFRVEESAMPFVFDSEENVILFLKYINKTFNPISRFDFILISHILRDCNNPDVELMVKFFELEVGHGITTEIIFQKVPKLKNTLENALMLSYCCLLHYINKIKEVISPKYDLETSTERQVVNILIQYMTNRCDNRDTKNIKIKKEQEESKNKEPLSQKKSGQDVLYESILNGPEYFRKMTAESIEPLLKNVSLSKFNLSIKQESDDTFISIEDTEDSKGGDKELSLKLTKPSHQRHLHCVSAGGTSGVLHVPCRLNLKLKTPYKKDERYVVTNACNNKQLIISFRVKGYIHRSWVFIEEFQNEENISVIEAPKVLTVAPFTGKQLKDLSGWFRFFSSTAEFYEFGLDRV